MTLKILSDFDCECDDAANCPAARTLIDKRKLKREGIKWHKHLSMTKEDNVFDFLEKFFGIIEDDLK